MTIYYNSIKKKENEWQPQNNIFLVKDEVERIIEEEKLKENMKERTNIEYDDSNQKFLKLLIPCKEYQYENIFLIKAESIEKNIKYFWCYVIKREFSAGNNVTITLMIDPITTNYDLFFSNNFSGEVYIERTTNIVREVNNIHSEICSKINNQRKEQSQDVPLEVNRNIDIFVSYNLIKQTKVLINQETKVTSTKLTFEDKGALLWKENWQNKEQYMDLTGYKALSPINFKFPTTTKLPPTVQYLLDKHTFGKAKFEDKEWLFPSYDAIRHFANELENHGSDKKLFKELDEFIKNNNIKRWLSVPNIFGFRNNIKDWKQIDVSFLKDIIDVKNHTHLHYEYTLRINEVWSIKLDPVKLKQNNWGTRVSIWATRVIDVDKIIYSFYYDVYHYYEISTITVDITNDLIDNSEWERWKNNKDIAEATGQRGYKGELENLKSNIFSSVISSLIGLGGVVTGNPALAIAGGFSLFKTAGSVIGSVMQIPFNLYKQEKQDQYQELIILSKPVVTKNYLSYESFFKASIQHTRITAWAWFYSSEEDTGQYKRKGYTVFNSQYAESDGANRWSLVIEKPLADDELKITLDQERYGNIVAMNFPKIDNILNTDVVSEVKLQKKDCELIQLSETREKHFYWKGAINPLRPPVSQSMMNNINTKLTYGIFIYKKRNSW